MTRSQAELAAKAEPALKPRPASAKKRSRATAKEPGDAGPVRPRGSVQRQTMGAQVADELRRQIIAGELAEGFQLRQEQLAAEFGISKVPVREALNQLEAEGLVIQQFHRGAVVAGLSLGEVMETFELRAQIETWLIGLAMLDATAEDVKEAGRWASLLGKTKDAASLPDLNWQFHQALYRPAGKSYVLEYVHKLHVQVERFVKMQFRLAVQMDQVVREHAELLRLYTQRDPAVQPCLHRHIMMSAERLAMRLAELGQRRP